MLTPLSPRVLPRAQTPIALRGCAGTLDNGYLIFVPLPRVQGPNLGQQWPEQHRSHTWESSPIVAVMQKTMAIILTHNSYIGSLVSPCSTVGGDGGASNDVDKGVVKGIAGDVGVEKGMGDGVSEGAGEGV